MQTFVLDINNWIATSKIVPF